MYNLEELYNQAMEGNTDALETLKSDAGCGSAEAQYILACLYTNGNSPYRNVSLGIYWFKKSAGYGFNPAIQKLKELSLENQCTTKESLADTTKEADPEQLRYIKKKHWIKRIVLWIIIPVLLLLLCTHVVDKIMALSIIIIVWSLMYKYVHYRHDMRLDYESEFPNLTTLNGCGASVFGGFRVANSDKYVYYIMLTAFFLPFIPLGCIVAKKKDTEEALLGVSTQYEIFGKTKMTFWEVIWCYASRWGLILFAISLIFYQSAV